MATSSPWWPWRWSCAPTATPPVLAAAPSVAERLGIPCRYIRYIAYCPQILVSRHHPPAFIPGARGRPGLLNRFPWWFFLGLNERLLRPAVNRARRRLAAALRDALEHPDRRERARLQSQLHPARALRETREWLEAAVAHRKEAVA